MWNNYIEWKGSTLTANPDGCIGALDIKIYCNFYVLFCQGQKTQYLKRQQKQYQIEEGCRKKLIQATTTQTVVYRMNKKTT